MVIWNSNKVAKFLMGLRDDILTLLIYQGVQTYVKTIAATYKVEQVNVEQLNVAMSS